eukprot:3947730-Pleurochrysis_carterae.AAC.1
MPMRRHTTAKPSIYAGQNGSKPASPPSACLSLPSTPTHPSLFPQSSPTTSLNSLWPPQHTP